MNLWILCWAKKFKVICFLKFWYVSSYNKKKCWLSAPVNICINMHNVYYTYTLICKIETTFCNCNKLHVSEKETWSCKVKLTHIWFRYTLIEMEFTEQRSIGQWLLKRVSRIQSFVESEGVLGIIERKLYSRVEYLNK